MRTLWIGAFILLFFVGWVPTSAANDKDDVRQYRQSCARGTLVDCYNLGAHYISGLGVPKDPAKAAKLFKKGCQGGERAACYALGTLYMRGLGVSKNMRKATKLFDKACKAGHVSACFNLAKQYLAVDKNIPTAVKLLVEACKSGHMKACYNRGVMYEHGNNGLAKNQKKAIEMYKKACTGDVAEACFNLGIAYLHGNGVKKDANQALGLFIDACYGGDNLGCTRALEMVKPACENNVLPACALLGTMYRDGKGVPQDIKKAFNAFKKACEGGYEKACDFKIPVPIKQK